MSVEANDLSQEVDGPNITAMWLRAPKTGSQGVNVAIYKHPNGLPHGGNIDEIIKNPGPREEAIRYNELPPGVNRVQARPDLVLEDADYDQGAIDRVLHAIETSRLNEYMSKPLLPFEEKLSRGTMKGLFQINLGPLTTRSHALPQIQATWVTPDGRLDKEALLRAFLEFWRQHGEPLLATAPYHEIAPHLVLMAFRRASLPRQRRRRAAGR